MKHVLIIVSVMFITLGISAQKVSYKEVMRIKSEFEYANKLNKTVLSTTPLLVNNDTVAFIFNYTNAFIVISTKKELPPVKAYSVENNLPFDDNGLIFRDFIVSDYRLFLENPGLNKSFAERNKKAWSETSFQTTKTQYGPLLSSLFGQTNCKDQNNHTINVTNLFTPHNYACGCVALTFTEVLHYFRWPRIGVGTHSYTDNYGNTKGSHSVNYESSYINWANILDEYYKKPSSSVQRNELGKLAYNCAVAVNMDFEYNGSTSNINRIPAAANKHYRYTADYIEKSNPQFWARVDSNIIHDLPVQFAIYTSSGGGHAVVGDGLKFQNQGTRYYHLNMGWWGSSNGWYNIQGNFNAGGYTDIRAAVVDMVPVPEMTKPKISINDQTVKVEWYYSQVVNPECYELQVKEGNANWVTVAADIKGKTYNYKYKSTVLHRFRVRAKYNGKWKTDGWSNYESIDIENEINNLYPEEMEVYPTLTLNTINAEYKYMPGSILSIFNSAGKCVYSEKIDEDSNAGKRSLSVVLLPSGVYFLRVYNNRESQSKKFIKL